MKRIDPTTVPDVFRRRGLTPVCGDWVGDADEGECCILSALYCDARGCTHPPECLREINRASDELNLIVPAIGLDDREYALGVYSGWDHDNDATPETPESYRQGYADGAAARAACVAAGLEVNPLDGNGFIDDDFFGDDEDDFDDEEEDE